MKENQSQLMKIKSRLIQYFFVNKVETYMYKNFCKEKYCIKLPQKLV